MGNCGVTFAPAVPDDRAVPRRDDGERRGHPARSRSSAASPGTGRRTRSTSTPSSRWRRRSTSSSLVGHCAVRYQVMGDRSLGDEEPTATELHRMRDIVGESIAGGAVGYSTSRILIHVVPDGRPVPGTFASMDEHLAFADGMNDAGGGIFQAVLDFETRAGIEFQLLRAMAERAGDVLFAIESRQRHERRPQRHRPLGRVPDRDPRQRRSHHRLLHDPSVGLAGRPRAGAAGARAAVAGGDVAADDRGTRSPRCATTRPAPGSIEEGVAKGLLYDPRAHPPARQRRRPRVRRRGRPLRRRSGRRRRRPPGRARHRPAARERGSRAVQPLVLPPQPRGARRPAGARRDLPRRRRRRRARGSDLRRRRADPLPRLLVPRARTSCRCPKRCTGSRPRRPARSG